MTRGGAALSPPVLAGSGASANTTAHTFHPGLLRFGQRTARVLLPVAFRLQVSGLDHVPATGPVILAGNHSGCLDGPLVVLVSRRPVQALVKGELYGGPLGRLLLAAGEIPVRRGRPDRVALHAGLEALRRGSALVVFPEGTRGDGSLRQVQHGVAWLALHAGAPVVPVACTGTAHALPRGRSVPRLRAPVRVGFGPAFNVHTTADPNVRSALATVAEQIRGRLLEHVAHVAGPPAPQHAAH